LAEALYDGGDGGAGGSVQGIGIYASTIFTISNSTIALNSGTSGNGADAGGASGAGRQGGDGGAGGAAQGGGLWAQTGTAGISSSTIVSNSVAAGIGGSPGQGIGGATSGAAGVNGTPDGAGLYNAGATVTLLADIFAKNFGGTNVDVFNAFTSQGGNVFGSSPFSANPPSDKINTDPLLGKIQDNGGNTLTAALGLNSPAIGFAGNRTCLALDQRGQPRRAGYCDSGAFAVQPNSLQQVSGSGQSTVIATPFAAPLVVKPLYGTVVLTGASVTFTPSASGASATVNGAATAVVTAANGIAQVVAAANGVVGGPYNVVASSGTATPANFSLTNLLRPTTTSVSTSPNPSGPGLSVDVSASVTANGGTPTGNVNISADTGENCVIALPATSCSIVFLAPGARTVTANYPGDAQHAPSSANTQHNVVPGGGGTPPPGGGSQVVYVGAAFVNAESTF
jgi:hypothetical protein